MAHRRPPPAVAKAGSDVFVAAPLVYIPSFYMYTGVAQGKSVAAAGEHLRNKWWDTASGYVGVWLPLQFVNFLAVPLHGQVVFVNAATLLWNIYISYLSNSGGSGTSSEGEGEGGEGLKLAAAGGGGVPKQDVLGAGGGAGPGAAEAAAVRP
jgi:hypothetical protein